MNRVSDLAKITRYFTDSFPATLEIIPHEQEAEEELRTRALTDRKIRKVKDVIDRKRAQTDEQRRIQLWERNHPNIWASPSPDVAQQPPTFLQSVPWFSPRSPPHSQSAPRQPEAAGSAFVRPPPLSTLAPLSGQRLHQGGPRRP